MPMLGRSTRFLRRAVLPLAVIFAITLSSTRALAEEPAGKESPAPAQAEVAYPGLEEVVPRASQIDADAARALATLDDVRGPDAFAGQYERARKTWDEFLQLTESYGPQHGWPVNRLLSIRDVIETQSQTLRQLLDQIGAPLKTIEDLRKDWSDKLEYWEGWRESLDKAGARLPKQTFTRVRGSVAEVLSRCKDRSNSLLQLQEKISGLREEILILHEKIDADITALRTEPFRRNAHPLLSADYLVQFNPSLVNRTLEGIKATFQFDLGFFKRQGWLLALQAILAVALLVFFHRVEFSTSEKTDDWQFIFQRPVSAALFVALAAPRLFYPSPPPPLLQLFIVYVATICAARLACQLLKQGNQRTMIYTLSGLFLASKTFTALAIPLPIYRIYLVMMSVAGVPFLIWITRRHRRHFRGSFNRYLLALRAGAFILVVAFLAQVSGYATFAIRLIDATIGTVFLMLFALMALRIAEGAIELFFLSRLVSSSRIVRNLGSGVIRRFIRLSRIVIFIVAGLYLLEIWGLFDTITDAWQFIMALEYNIGQFHISFRMVALIVIVLYASVLASWFLQSFLDAEVFHGKKIDRGVRDAIKKLSHYAVVLFGFLLAMSMAGIELQNFAILAGAFGIGIGFGLQDIVNNFVSGLIMLFERPVKVGDAIIIDGQWGAISKIGMRSTVVETWDRSEIIVPNSQMISEKVVNWTLSSNVSRVTLKVGVKYGSDLQKVIDILNRIGDGHAAVVADPPPSAIFTEFGDSSINFELRVWVDDIKNRLSLISELGLAIDKAFKDAGIEIPFPQRDLHLRSVAPDIDLSGAGKST